MTRLIVCLPVLAAPVLPAAAPEAAEKPASPDNGFNQAALSRGEDGNLYRVRRDDGTDWFQPDLRIYRIY